MKLYRYKAEDDELREIRAREWVSYRAYIATRFRLLQTPWKVFGPWARSRSLELLCR